MKHLSLVAIVVLFAISGSFALTPEWQKQDIEKIHGLSLASLPPLLRDESNRVADDPAAAALGKSLFFDARFSANGAVSCSTCHVAEHQFQDGLPVGVGVGTGTRRTMSIAGTAYHPFFFWDGRKDSQWSQALGPVENPVEHGSDRTMVAGLMAANYRAEYEAIFGPLPDLSGLPPHAAPAGSAEAIAAWAQLQPIRQRDINRVFSNFGKAIEAFERTIPPPVTRFDSYAAAIDAGDYALADSIFNEHERNGLRVFINDGACLACHDGPLLTDKKFHNIGLPGETLAADAGRTTSVFVVQQDPFNCKGEFSDSDPSRCNWLKYLRMDDPALVGAFKSQSLRGVAQRPPYMHDGSFATLHDVLVHYNTAPKALVGRSEIVPRKLTDQQLDDLEAFLRTLDVKE